MARPVPSSSYFSSIFLLLASQLLLLLQIRVLFFLLKYFPIQYHQGDERTFPHSFRKCSLPGTSSKPASFSSSLTASTAAARRPQPLSSEEWDSSREKPLLRPRLGMSSCGFRPRDRRSSNRESIRRALSLKWPWRKKSLFSPMYLDHFAKHTFVLCITLHSSL